jgi:hypothetical protein
MGSTSSNPGNGGQGNVQLRGLGATSTLVLLDGRRLIPANGSVFSAGNRAPHSVANSHGALDPYLANDRVYTYNFAPWNYLQLLLERVSAFGRASFDFGPRYRTGADAGDGAAPAPVQSAHSRRLRFRARFSRGSVADVLMSKRMAERGPRISSTQHGVYQATLGSHGDAFGDWTHDAYVPLCFDARTNPDFNANYALCLLFSREPATGAIVGLQGIGQNIVGYEVSGIDTQVDRSAGLGLRAGVENLIDATPLLLASRVAANTDPSRYDVSGRRFSVSASYKF